MSKKEEHFLAFEEHFHKDELKRQRKEKKRIQTKDRSRFKKTDQDKVKKQEPLDKEHLLQGRVIAILAQGILLSSQGKTWTCTLKGSLKQFKEKVKSLIAVGDFVLFEETSPSHGLIVHIEERFSILSRADHLSQQKEQLIAVNVDQVIITASVVSPPLKPFLIDRYLIAAKKGNLHPILVINKIDLLETGSEEERLYQEVCQTYAALGITVFPMSIKTGEGLAALKQALAHKTSVFSGQSGTGKSSLINATLGTSLLTGPIVARTKKGSHTTTATELIPLENEGFCVDTPGVQSFGLWKITAAEIESYYAEIVALKPLCKYADCTHREEQECAVKHAVAEGRISSLRFASYLALMASLSETHHPR